MDWLKQECSQKKLFVLPAFETAELPSMAAAHRVAAKAAASDKQGLQKMVDDQQVWQFALKIFREVCGIVLDCMQLCLLYVMALHQEMLPSGTAATVLALACK
jgi:hypothetical protein